MPYSDVVLIANDYELLARITACVAIEMEADGGGNPEEWAQQHRWRVAARPGWAEKYSSAVVAGVEWPGKDEQVISDDMIHEAVLALRKDS